ncbi:MAG: hypothetical protein ABMA64_21345 [Myxococcota bacterium]
MILTLGHAALAKDAEPAPFQYDWQPLDPSSSAVVTREEVEAACACSTAGAEVATACDDPTAPLPTVAQVRVAADCVSVEFGPSRQRSATRGAWVDRSTAFVGLADFLVDRADRELRAYALREAGEACAQVKTRSCPRPASGSGRTTRSMCWWWARTPRPRTRSAEACSSRWTSPCSRDVATVCCRDV